MDPNGDLKDSIRVHKNTAADVLELRAHKKHAWHLAPAYSDSKTTNPVSVPVLYLGILMVPRVSNRRVPTKVRDTLHATVCMVFVYVATVVETHVDQRGY